MLNINTQLSAGESVMKLLNGKIIQQLVKSKLAFSSSVSDSVRNRAHAMMPFVPYNEHPVPVRSIISWPWTFYQIFCWSCFFLFSAFQRGAVSLQL